MLTYANSFSCSANQNKSEFILTVRQVSPIINEAGVNKGMNSEVVSQLVLTADGAASLCALLDTMLGSGQK